MSAYDEFCGCGEYSCRECFPDLADKGAVGNAWLDEAWRESQRREKDALDSLTTTQETEA